MVRLRVASTVVSPRVRCAAIALGFAAWLVAALAPAQPIAHGPRFYTAVANDSYDRIASIHHITVAELADRNHLVAPYPTLRVGTRLRLPSRAGPTPGAETPAHPTTTTARIPPPPPRAQVAPPPPPPERSARVAPRPSGGGRWGTPSHPGVVSLVRVATGERVTVNLRRPGPRTRGVMRSFLRSASGAMHPIDARLLRQLAVVSDHFGGRTLEVISGFRPRRRRQWTAHSNHNIGRAIDFRVSGVSNRVTRDFCRTLPATGCGFYPRSVFIHMDVRAGSAYWVDWSRPGERPHYGSEDHPPGGAHPTAVAHAPTPPESNDEVDDVADDDPAIRTEAPDPDDANDTPTPPGGDTTPAPTPAPAPPATP